GSAVWSVSWWRDFSTATEFARPRALCVSGGHVCGFELDVVARCLPWRHSSGPGMGTTGRGSQRCIAASGTVGPCTTGPWRQPTPAARGEQHRDCQTWCRQCKDLGDPEGEWLVAEEEYDLVMHLPLLSDSDSPPSRGEPEERVTALEG